jgi:hypothetical protein
MVQPLMRPGNCCARRANFSPTGEKHSTTCRLSRTLQQGVGGRLGLRFHGDSIQAAPSPGSGPARALRGEGKQASAGCAGPAQTQTASQPIKQHVKRPPWPRTC